MTRLARRNLTRRIKLWRKRGYVYRLGSFWRRCSWSALVAACDSFAAGMQRAEEAVRRLYEREAVSTRIVEVDSSECWSATPSVFVVADEEVGDGSDER